MTASLISRYDGLVCDLDGVVYAGPSAIEHAVESLNRVQQDGLSVVYATNNASRPGAEVAEHLSSLGLRCGPDDVINSSVAGASVLARRASVKRVLAVGGEGVAQALSAAGFAIVTPDEHREGAAVDAVLQGYGPRVCASGLAEAAYAIQQGALWGATNPDSTLPTDRGRAPGNGSLVGSVRCAVTHDPLVAGKPGPVMYELATERMGTERRRVLAVGDRLETDVQGAVTGGFDSVLVLTGVHGWADAAAAPPERRPTYVVNDLRGLLSEYRVDDVVTSDAFKRATTLSSLRGALSFAWGQVDQGAWTPHQAREQFEALRTGASG